MMESTYKKRDDVVVRDSELMVLVSSMADSRSFIDNNSLALANPTHELIIRQKKSEGSRSLVKKPSES